MHDHDQGLAHDLNRLQLTTLEYYLHENNPATGLMRDKTEAGAPASIAAVGLAMASIPVLVERGARALVDAGIDRDDHGHPASAATAT